MLGKSDTQIFFFSLVIILFINFVAGENFKGNLTNQILLFLIPLIWPGVAHGSLDFEIAKKMGLVKNNFQTISFFFLYITIPLIFFYLWIIFPTIFFILFMVLSYLHFGISDNLSNKNINRYFEIIIRGGVVILLPIFFHFETTRTIFEFLLADETILVQLEKYKMFLGMFVLISIIFWLISNLYTKGYYFLKEVILLEIILLSFCFIFFEPLISFFTYFCFLHSVRHICDEKEYLNLNFRQIIIKSLPFTIITILFFGFLYYYFAFFDYHENMLSFVFVGLASLTTSHIILVNFTKK